jgi:hypothetical protein
MALRFPAKKKPKPQQSIAHPDPHISMGDGGQAPRPDAASPEAFHLELDLHPEELSLLKKLSEQFVRLLGSLTPRALRKPRPRKPKSLPRTRSGAAGRKVTSVRRKVARRR